MFPTGGPREPPEVCHIPWGVGAPGGGRATRASRPVAVSYTVLPAVAVPWLPFGTDSPPPASLDRNRLAAAAPPPAEDRRLFRLRRLCSSAPDARDVPRCWAFSVRLMSLTLYPQTRPSDSACILLGRCVWAPRGPCQAAGRPMAPGCRVALRCCYEPFPVSVGTCPFEVELTGE